MSEKVYMYRNVKIYRDDNKRPGQRGRFYAYYNRNTIQEGTLYEVKYEIDRFKDRLVDPKMIV